MTEFQVHPVCTAFPEYTAEVYAARLADYKAHPERAGDTAVVLALDEVDGEWKIADGRHHHRICVELGYVCDIRFTRFKGTPAELADFVLARNAHRRHETESQRAASIAAVMKWARGGDHGNQHTVGKGARAPLPQKTQQQAADEAGISRDTLKRAVKVAREAPELLPVVRDGKIDAKTAAEATALPAEIRKVIVASPNPKLAAKKSLSSKKDGSHRKSKKSLGKDISKMDRQIAKVAHCPAVEVTAIRKAMESLGLFPAETRTDKASSLPEADEWGIPIQPHAVEAFAAVPKFKELVQAIAHAQKLFNEVANQPGGVFLTLPDVSSYRRGKRLEDGSHADRFVHEGLEEALRQVKNAVPTHTICPWNYVEAEHPEKCSTCLDNNWTPVLGKNIPEAAIRKAKEAHGV